MNQRLLIGIIILAGIGSIGSVLAYTGTITANQGSFNNVLVTGTCSGCGAGEGSFTTYSLIVNKTITGSGTFTAQSFITNNTGTAYMTQAVGSKQWIVDSSGTITQLTANGAELTNNGYNPITSITGLYTISQDSSTKQVSILKNYSILTTISESNAFNFPGQQQGSISPNGKYIVLIGKDTSTADIRIQIWRGS